MLLKRMSMVNWLKTLRILRLLILVIWLKKTNTKANEIERKITDHDQSNKYITTQTFNTLMADNFAGKVKQANLASWNNYAEFV